MEQQTSEREKLLDIKTNQEFHNNYRIVSKDRTSDNLIASPIGEGGSGIVFLAEQTFVGSIKVNRAIKFFVYRDDIANQTIHQFSDRISSKNFNDEILNISSFNHENIIKIIDGGIIEKNGHSIPFIVTDYVAGHTLKDLLIKHELIDTYISDGQDIIDLFGQICNGLEYLHKRDFYHCDIAPKNIFIKGEKGNFQIVIGDLGLGKTLRKNVVPVDNKLFVHGTRDYMPQSALAVRNKEIEYKEFLKLQPEWDLFALQRTFQDLISVIENRRRTNLPWFKSLKNIINRDFVKITSVAKDIERQKPIYRQTAGTPELSEADSTTHGHKIVQPIKSVWVTDRIEKIIRHPLFFRLKKVPQLLSANTFNPGSNHTRYEHSLGTYENMRQVLITLLRKGDFIELLDEKNIELALLASILSSISKFPFSFLIHEIKNRDKDYFPKIKQKKLLLDILNYKNVEKGIDESIWEIIEKNFNIESIDMLIEIISGDVTKWTKQVKIINKLLNSSIDVRVLDFLPRDSYHIGISSGAHIDFESLIDSICIHEDTIAVRSRGVTCVEQVITLRYWLYKRIYWNSPNRAYASALKYIFTKLYLSKPDFEEKLLKEVFFWDPIDILHFLNDETKDCKENGKDYVYLNNLLKTIFCEQPTFLKEIFVINQTESTSAQLNNICKKFSEMPFLQLEKFRIELENELTYVISYQPNNINVILDIPNEQHKKLGGDLTVIKNDESPMRIDKFSGLIGGISDTFDDNIKFLRVYLNPIYKNQLKAEPSKYKEIRTIIKKFLNEHEG